ncbi:PEP-CTERM sorting domain-containing protein [Roseateles sp.]|uniref:PEP-CTERM sorting domain-containing protein n=1 Tax=Roseateles sp. TaxID=1971397 RepID=UPI003D0BCA46
MNSAHRLSILAAAIAGLATLAPAAWANPTLSVSSGATAGAFDATPNESSSSTLVSSYSYIDNIAGTGSAYAFSSATGAYAVSSNAKGMASAATKAGFAYSLLNTSNVTQTYTLKFKIYGGSLSTQLQGGSWEAGEFLESRYGASVQIGNTEVFSSSAKLSANQDGIVLDREGANLNALDDGSDGYYSWDAFYVEVDRTLAAGDSLELAAYLNDEAYAHVGTYEGNCGGSNYNTVGSLVPLSGLEEGSCYKGSSSSFYGDPFSTDAIGFEVTIKTPNSVPEPGSFALAGLGLGLAALARRRRNSTN